MNKHLIADEGKIFAYKDENGNQVELGEELFLGINDDGSRYYQIDKPIIIEKEGE